MQEPRSEGADWRQQLDELSARVIVNRAEIDALQADAVAASLRADASDARADANDVRAGLTEARVEEHDGRIAGLEEKVDVDRAMLAELQADGILRTEHTAHLEEALHSSRRIGAAIGIIMARCKVSEQVAFAMLVASSQRANRKVRLIAEDVVRTGDVSQLSAA